MNDRAVLAEEDARLARVLDGLEQPYTPQRVPTASERELRRLVSLVAEAVKR